MLLKPLDLHVPAGAVRITLELFEEDDRIICGIYACDVVRSPGTRLISAARQGIGLIEDMMRKAGVAEVRLGGRDWSRILTDYERLEGVENGLRKAL